MPVAPLPIDRDEVLIVARAVGLREAARRFGLSENTVKSWSRRAGIDMRSPAEKAAQSAQANLKSAKQELLAISAPMHPTAAECLDYRVHGAPTRDALARSARKGAERLASLKPSEVVEPDNVAALVGITKVAEKVHSWSAGDASTSPLTLNLAIAIGSKEPEVIENVSDVADAEVVE